MLRIEHDKVGGAALSEAVVGKAERARRMHRHHVEGGSQLRVGVEARTVADDHGAFEQIGVAPGDLDEELASSLQEEIDRTTQDLQRAQSQARDDADAIVRLKDVISEARNQFEPALKESERFLKEVIAPAVQNLKAMEERLERVEAQVRG